MCFNTYGVKFPMFTTTPVRGKDAHPLFAQLASVTGKQSAWNFNKYLVDRQAGPWRTTPAIPTLTAPS